MLITHNSLWEYINNFIPTSRISRDGRDDNANLGTFEIL